MAETTASINATRPTFDGDGDSGVQGLGITSPARPTRQRMYDGDDDDARGDNDVLAFAKRLLSQPLPNDTDAAAGGTTGPSSPPAFVGYAQHPGVQRTASSGKRPVFTRDHSRTSSSGSLRSLRNNHTTSRREDPFNSGEDVSLLSMNGAASGHGSRSAGPTSPTSGITAVNQGEGGSPRKLRLLASSMGRRQASYTGSQAHASSSNSEEKKALAKLVSMYESLVSKASGTAYPSADGAT